MLAQWGVFVRLTFWELSWSFPSSVADELQIGEEACACGSVCLSCRDVMEPLTYFTGSGANPYLAPC